MDLVERFEGAELETLRHTDHVRLACAYLDRHDEGTTLALLLGGLARFAAAKGQPEKFHYTMTRAWLELILDARRRYPDTRTADELMAACPLLTDAGAINRFYSREALLTEAARAGWVAPDLQPISATI